MPSSTFPKKISLNECKWPFGMTLRPRCCILEPLKWQLFFNEIDRMIHSGNKLEIESILAFCNKITLAVTLENSHLYVARLGRSCSTCLRQHAKQRLIKSRTRMILCDSGCKECHLDVHLRTSSLQEEMTLDALGISFLISSSPFWISV